MKLLLLLLCGVLDVLKHSRGDSLSRLFSAVYIILNVPQDRKEHIFDFFNFRFMFVCLLCVHKLYILSCLCPVLRAVFREAVVISISWFRAVIPFTAVS